MTEIKTFTIKDSFLYNLALDIRCRVFIEEQNVPPELEVEHEKTATFYLLFMDDLPVATGRWRETENGIKLERFAVLPPFRNQNLGTILLKKVLSDLKPAHEKIYLHSQVRAIRYYERQGFQKIGEMFEEAGIWHFTMILST